VIVIVWISIDNDTVPIYKYRHKLGICDSYQHDCAQRPP